jgi:hypothetical protein
VRRPAGNHAGCPRPGGQHYECEGRFEDRTLTGMVRFTSGDATLPLTQTVTNEATCAAHNSVA